MPYIKKIEVNGFKTFGKKTTLILDKGFTVITGPNGSGKTNIIDAVLFCLGELSTRRLRASNFSSLIYNGNSNSEVKSKGRAKVTIQLDNSDGHIPLDTNTVTISREIDHEGQSIYRVNGRKVSRAYLLSILSMASISPYGHNVILQGTLTHLAEISPLERRKIIEDLIGIAQYDNEKAEAQRKLESANISIQTAMGQVGEVQRRIESLERERNDLIRHNLIQSEIKHLEAIKLSYEIRNSHMKINQISSQMSKLQEKIGAIKEHKDALWSRRRNIESEWRKTGLEKVEEGQAHLLGIQMKIGELRSRLSELSTKITAGKFTLNALNKVKDDASNQIESLNKEIQESEARIKSLMVERNSLIEKIEAEQSLYDEIYREAMKIRSNLQEKSEKIREIEARIDQIHQEVISARSSHADSQSRIDVYSERLKNLEDKRSDLSSSVKRLEESLNELLAVQKEQTEHFDNLRTLLERRMNNKKILEAELKEADKIAEIAREAYVEFEARKDLIEQLNTEEKILKYMEELGEMGAIQGIYGRLRNLTKIRKGYERAVEAAAAGWLDSLVVQDLNVAFTCAETLRRLKLGRIKIIPLQEISLNSQARAGKTLESMKKVAAYVDYAEKYRPAVSFVLGDTVLASDEKEALKASHMGYRSVTLNGDLYESGGGVETGFFRTPVDFSFLIPSESALKALDKAVNALKEVLSRRDTRVEEIEKEINEIQGEITKLAEAMGKINSEVERTRTSLQQAKINLNRVEKNITNLKSLLMEEKKQIEEYEKRLNELAQEEALLRDDAAHLRKEISLVDVQEKEERLGVLGNEIITLRQKLGEVETELSTIQSKVDNVLKPSLEKAYTQIKDVTRQISLTEKEVEDSLREKENVQMEIERLEEEKQILSTSLLNVKEEGKKFTSQIDEIDGHLKILDKEYEETDRLIDELRLNLQTLNLQVSRWIEQLKALGYEEPLEVTSTEVEEAENFLKIMKFELERIGPVNNLAQAQYEEQISRYKELSLRMNELEKEKVAIEDFIQEIEKKKYNAFMEAYNKINERIGKYFSKLTDGGNAYLKLENPENPFEGGVDMVVQFVGKPPILMSGASSGERSVSSVAFLFALREFTPASFYLLDEIDAHLDAFHVERLGELLAEEAERSQFVVITLKPEMVSKADRIYGIYGRNGMSQVVSTTFKGAV